MKPVTDFELKFMSDFLTTGIQMIPNNERSAYEGDEQYNFVVFVTERLKKFYALYDVKTPLYATGDKEW
jgi:hypothetical protein